MTDLGKYCILIHYHEIAIKGGNRKWFENIFARNIKLQLTGLTHGKISANSARVFVLNVNPEQWPEYASRLKNVMGLMNATLMIQIVSGLDDIKATAAQLIEDITFETFRVSARRQYKNYPLSSGTLNQEVGAHLQELCGKPVKLKGADLDVKIEIVKDFAYVGVKKIRGYGGLPVGVSEKAVSLLSSGIDSPVASFEMLKRGVSLIYVHFHSAPVTSRQSIKNVLEILQVLAHNQMKCELYSIPLLEIQQKIMSTAPNKYWVILFRRAMVRLADMLAVKNKIPALVTGENVGQVASQTLSNIRAVDDATTLPILRPLAGHNKEDIINRAREIGTYEISIEPYQDCCSFFVPPHPDTKANLEIVRGVEEGLHLTELYEKALEEADVKLIRAPYLDERR